MLVPTAPVPPLIVGSPLEGLVPPSSRNACCHREPEGRNVLRHGCTEGHCHLLVLSPEGCCLPLGTLQGGRDTALC